MSSEILEENENRNGFLTLGSNNDHFEGVIKGRVNTNFIKIKLDENENHQGIIIYYDRILEARF